MAWRVSPPFELDSVIDPMKFLIRNQLNLDIATHVKPSQPPLNCKAHIIFSIDTHWNLLSMNDFFHSCGAKSFKKLPHYNFHPSPNFVHITLTKFVAFKVSVLVRMEKLSHCLMLHKFAEALENLKLTQFTSHVILRQTVALHDNFHRQEGVWRRHFIFKVYASQFTHELNSERELQWEFRVWLTSMTLIGALHIIKMIRCAKY